MDFNLEDLPEELRKDVEAVKACVDPETSNQDIFEALVECYLNPDDAVLRLLSRGVFEEVQNKRDKKNKTNNTRSAQDGTLNRMAGSSTTSGISAPSPSNSHLTSGGSKILPPNSGEAIASSSSATSPVISHQPPSNSELINRQTKGVPVRSGKAVSLSSVPSSKNGSFITRERTMADVLKMKMGLSSSKESVTKAPAKDDCPTNEKPYALVFESDQLVDTALFNEDVTSTKSDLTDAEATTSCIIGHQAQSNSILVPISSDEAATSSSVPSDPYPSSNSLVEFAATSDQLSESASVLRDDDKTFASKFKELCQMSASEYNEKFPDGYPSFFPPAAEGEQQQMSVSDMIKNLPEELLEVNNPDVMFKYHHPRQGGGSVAPVSLSSLGYPLRLGEKECSYYMRTGQCKFGLTCRFNHPVPLAVQGAPQQQQQPQPQLQTMYPTLQSQSVPSSQQYGLVLARPPLLPSSYLQSPYGPPMVLPPRMVPYSGWNPYQASISAMPSPGTQPSIGSSSVYGITPLSPSATAYAGTYQSGASSYPSREQSFPQRPDQPECQYFMRTGDCKFGSSCRYHHPLDAAPPKTGVLLSSIGLPLRPGVAQCTHFAQHGICKFGPACKFDHSMSSSLSYSPSASSLTDMPVAPYPIGSSSLSGASAPVSSSSEPTTEAATAAVSSSMVSGQEPAETSGDSASVSGSLEATTSS